MPLVSALCSLLPARLRAAPPAPSAAAARSAAAAPRAPPVGRQADALRGCAGSVRLNAARGAGQRAAGAAGTRRVEAPVRAAADQQAEPRSRSVTAVLGLSRKLYVAAFFFLVFNIGSFIFSGAAGASGPNYFMNGRPCNNLKAESLIASTFPDWPPGLVYNGPGSPYEDGGTGPDSKCGVHNPTHLAAVIAAERACILAWSGFVHPPVISFENAASTGAWLPFGEEQRDDFDGTLRWYRFVLPTHAKHGRFSDFRYPMDGTSVYMVGGKSSPYLSLMNGYPAVKLGKERDQQHRAHHEMVAWLWGAPDRSGMNGGPSMLNALTVDHINGNKNDWHIDNLQLITNRQNSDKGTRDDTNSGITVYPLHPYHDAPVNGAWLPYTLRCLKLAGSEYKYYRSFMADDAVYGDWASVLYPSDGSAVVFLRRADHKKMIAVQTGGSNNGYPSVVKSQLNKATTVDGHLRHHEGVAMLYGVPNNSGLSARSIVNVLVTDHIRPKSKMDYSAANLQQLAAKVNSGKDSPKRKR